jgi:hypothetical protein
MTANLPVLNLFFYVTPGSAQATYSAAAGNVVSSASGNPTVITQAGDATGGTNKIAVPVTSRWLITLSISAATTFSIFANGVSTLMPINGVAGASTVINGVHTFEILMSPASYGTAGLGFRFGADCTINYFMAAWQAV